MDEEKQMEIEALKAIFNEHFQGVNNTKFDLTIFPSIDLINDAHVVVTMSVDISGAYPNAPPQVTVTPQKGKLNNMITTAQCNTLTEEVTELSKQHLGIPHIYILAQHIQNKLADLQEQLKTKEKHNDNADISKTQANENSDSDSDSEYNGTYQLIQDGGTPVTVENFKRWKEQFEKEFQTKKKTHRNNLTNDNTLNDSEKRLTGRQFFELNKNKAEIDWELFATEHEELELRNVLKTEDLTKLSFDEK